MTDCNLVEITLPYSNVGFGVRTMNHEDVLDVLYTFNANTTSNPDCQNYLCKVTYNLHGKVIINSTKFMKKSGHSIDVDDDASTFFPLQLYEYDSSNSIPMMFVFKKFDNEHPKNVALYRVDKDTAVTKVFSTNASFSGWSPSHSKVSFCTREKDGWTKCQQYDSKANLLMNINLNLSDFSKHPENVRLQSYNLRDGGFILFFIESIYETTPYPVNTDMKILYISNESQWTSPLEIPFGRLNVSGYPHFEFLDKDTKFCLKLISNNFHMKQSYVEYLIQCFPKNYLNSRTFFFIN